MAKWDSRKLEIRTKSVEQTLVPLVTQITTLVNHRERPKRSPKARKAVHEVGQALEKAVQKFVDVGEAIARENPELCAEMTQACVEARNAAKVIGELTDMSTLDESSAPKLGEKGCLVRGARGLLSAVTRVLILADMVVIQRLLNAGKKVETQLQELEAVSNFTEFVKAFSQFGADMVEFAHLSGDRQNDLKDDTLRAELCAARAVLEKSTMMLLTSSKTCLRHPDSPSAQENRDSVFKRMREAIAIVNNVVQNGTKRPGPRKGRLVMVLKNFDQSIENCDRNSLSDPETRKTLERQFQLVQEDVQSVSDAPHTRRDKGDRLMALCDNMQELLEDVLERTIESSTPVEGFNLSMQRISKMCKELKHEVHQVAVDQVFETFSHLGHKKSLPALRASASSGHESKVEELIEVFIQDAKRLEEVSRVARNMSASEPIAVTADHVEENIRTFCPQVSNAARTLCNHPVSKIAQENMEVFVEAWEIQVEELGKVLRSITAGGDLSKSESTRRGKKSTKADGYATL